MQSPKKSGTIAYLYLAFFCAVIAFFVASALRYPVGSAQEVTGTIESTGYTDMGGGGLRGRTSKHVTVRLPSGNLVKIIVPTYEELALGTKVILNEVPQSFGQPDYDFIRLSSSSQP